MKTSFMPYATSSARNQRGLSLVELMIALTIGLLLLLGITTLIVHQSRTRDELEKSSRQIENGRYAMQILHDEIQHAGFYGEYYSSGTPPATLPDPCATGATAAGLVALRSAMPLPIQGYNSAATSPITTCIPAANFKPGTDILVVRRAATEPETGTINPSTPPEALLQSTAANYVLDVVSASFNVNNPPLPAPFTLTGRDATIPATLREYWVRIYFISPCSTMANGSTCTASDDNGRPIPTLKMLDVTGENAGQGPISLVEGIENLQLDYGLDTNADGYPESYTMAPATTTDWSNVMAVRVNLLARNTECTGGYADNKSYTLGAVGAVSAPASTCTGGDYKRHVFSELVRAVNPSGRRAQQ